MKLARVRVHAIDRHRRVGDARLYMQSKGDGDVTLTDHADGETAPWQPALPTTPLDTTRYAVGNLIGKGGMGEVFAATDRQIGRQVAIKRTKTLGSDRQLARFFREALIQGRLDHPAIAPVHELGVDQDGHPYFVMKKLAGTTLAEQIADRRPREALLRAFVGVCLAVQFAHERGIVHRDLKPSNVMLGEYGEVYVLDWGIARIVGVADEPDTTATIAPADETAPGVMMGSPGYIAPEQIRAAKDADARADIYSLGCVLFEILAGESLHRRGAGALSSALGGADARPSLRGREVPPELDSLCMNATELDPAKRTQTARELADRVQRFLDGDRDLARRHDLASQHLASAKTAFETGERADAMRDAGRALALSPGLAGAAELVSRLMLEPPAGQPADVKRAIEAEDRVTQHRYARLGAAGYLAFLAMLPILFDAFTFHSVGLALIIVLNLVILLTGTFGNRRMLLVTATNALVIAIVARMFSPFFIAPGVAAVITMSLVLSPSFDRRPLVYMLMVLMALSVLGPWVLEELGYARQTMIIHPDGIRFIGLEGEQVPDAYVLVGLVSYVCALIAVAGITGHSMRRTEREMRERLHMQAWHLRQLVPDAAHT